MKNIINIFIGTILIFSTISFVIIPEDMIVKAISGNGGEDTKLDNNFIYNITKKLSDVIFDAPLDHGIQKGRAFGTNGERWAADNILEDEMIELGLYNVTLEPIENISGIRIAESLLINLATPAQGKLTTKPDILDYQLTIKNLTSNNTITPDCYISVRWNDSNHFSPSDTYNLTHNFSYTGLVIREEELNISIINLSNYIFNEILTNFTGSGYFDLLNYIILLFENYYNFTFANIDSENTSTWPSYMRPINISQDFVFIREAQYFNPKYLTETEKFLKFHIGIRTVAKIIMNNYGLVNHKCYEPYLKGTILFDYSNESHNWRAHDSYLNDIYINGTDGKPIFEDMYNHTVDFYINQRWNTSVESYNVIGQINGTNQNKTIILSSLYDSSWSQGTADSAIGIGIILAIAKHMKKLETEYNIKPKYNVKFIAFGGEEYDMRGAWSYEKKHQDEKIQTVIDLNQLGFTQEKPKCTLHILTNKIYHKMYTLQEISSITDYKTRTGDTTDFHIGYYPFGSVSNDLVFALKRGIIPPFNKNTNTVMFLKDFGWILHHRDGVNHTEGDSMKYYNWTDTNVTAELVWNVTKFYAIDPDCWFENEPTFTYYDSNDDDSFYDSVNTTFTLNTTMPKEHVTVRLHLYPKFKLKHPLYPLLYRCRDKKDYDVTPDGKNGYFNISIPDNFPRGDYVVKLYICDSNDDTVINTFDSIQVIMSGLKFVDYIRDITDIDLLESLHPYADEFLDFTGLKIIDWLSRLHDIRKVRKFLVDFTGYNVFADDKSYDIEYMSPSNNPPNPPNQPTDLGKKWGSHRYKTKTIDPDSGDKIRYQWNWNGINGHWSIAKYDSNEDHIKRHIWWIEGEKKVKVRAKNPWSPNVFSNWSEELTVDIGASCSFNIATSQSSQNNMNNPYVVNSFNQNVVVAGETVTYQGGSCGVGESPSYDYTFEGFSGDYAQKNQPHTFNEIGSKYVNLSVSQGGVNVFYNTTINVVNISSCFDMNKLGAQPNQTIIFEDTTISKYSINNWTWSFDDGHINYSQDVNHSFSQTGIYNVTLNITDSNGESSEFWQIVHVETNLTDFITASYNPLPGTLGCNVTISAEFWDNNESGIDNAYVNISYPNGSTNNFSMILNENSTEGYEYVFNDTQQVGWYYFTLWVTDNCGNINDFAGCGFEILPAFGYSKIGNLSKNIKDNISGSNFTCLVNGTAESISAYIQTNQTPNAKTKCIIYRENDSQIVGTTEEKIISTGDEPNWVTYNFTGTKPSLTTDTNYILSCWSNDTCLLYYDNVTDNSIGRYKNITYGNSPSPNITWDGEDSNLYSIYCTYSTIPEIISVSASPDPIGFGFNTTITAEIEHYYTLVENITVNITYPDDTFVNNSMSKVDDDTFQYIFDDAWLVGQYNYSIWVKDELGANCSGSGYSFNVSANATISVCTIKDSYDNNESVNLTDPPGGSSQIGYEYLDDGKVLHIWNQYDNYYFNTSSGIQMTNHYNNYWTHNVLMLGYYNNNQWNLIYRTDELSGFNKNIDTDNNSYVNVTIWKDLSYQGYDFRLAIRYYIGVNDNELTVIPYIKNIDNQDIPYVLGFGWEMKDIQIDMTNSGDYINVNRTMYYLDQTLDKVYTNLSEPVFYLMENITDTSTKSLYLRWNQSLNYKLQVKSRDGQYNAPVTLFVRIGTLDIGQEKYTEMYWYDAEQVTYYFNSKSSGEEWASNPSKMVDGNTAFYASTTSNGDVELCNGNDCSGTDIGTISKVELRVYSYNSGDHRDTILRPVFGGSTDGMEYRYMTGPSGMWSQWFDITNDPNAPQSWTWSEVDNLDCDVIAENEPLRPPFTLYCSKVELRVTYTPYNIAPGISNPVPESDATGVSIQPLLNITVSDADGDTMNISWLSNSSDSWTIFGTNSSVSDGTYHQIMSNATENGKWWYWVVNVSDGEDYNESSVYKFYTGNQSKIKNTGSTNIKGYLLIQVQYYNTTNSTWVVADDTINETTPRTINSDGQFGLDTVFNGNVNTTYLINNFGTGTYRIYAAFRDPDGDVLVCDDETLLEVSYQFTVTAS